MVLVYDAWPVLTRMGEYRFWTDAWNPSPTDRAPTFGIIGFVYGTVVTSLIAMGIAVPLGVATAAYLSEIAPPRVRRVSMFLIELLAAIPSVVYGFWGLRFLSPRIRELYEFLGIPDTGGQGLFPAGLVLAVMILPYITALTFDVCQAVPRSQREGSYSLGATRWQTIWKVAALREARHHRACFLALGRRSGDDGGDDARRQPAGRELVAVRAGRFARRRHRAAGSGHGHARIRLGGSWRWRWSFAVTAGFNIAARLLLGTCPVARDRLPTRTLPTAGWTRRPERRHPANNFVAGEESPAEAAPAKFWDWVMTRVLSASVFVSLCRCF